MVGWRSRLVVRAPTLACGQALRYLHAEGKVHRDVKAANVLLSEDGAVKLADLAMAANVADTTRRHGTLGFRGRHAAR